MNRNDVCILINSTPKYYYILPFMVGMLRRYGGSGLKWPIIVATEEPANPIIQSLNVRILALTSEQTGFLESRRGALEDIVAEFKYCLPLQDDFILEAGMDEKVIKDLLEAMDDTDDIVSARLMPCPGPKGLKIFKDNWNYLEATKDVYGFTFQATLWKTHACYEWYTQICKRLYTKIPVGTQQTSIEIRENLAENSEGQALFWSVSQKLGYKHVAWARKGDWSNAVYLSPFPYRPTAIVRGALEDWAKDLMKREGF
jgi:hypothetical protein